MKTFAFVSIVVLFVCIWHANTATHRSKQWQNPKEEPKNNILYEKYEYEVYDSKTVAWHYVEVKPIARNVLKINVTMEVNEPLTDIWVHAILYKKYTTYQKYLINIREDLCRIFHSLSNASPYTAVVMENVLRLVQANVPLKCPFKPGKLAAWADRLNASEISFPLMPAGRYRTDVYFSRMNPEKKYGLVKFYFSISDLRVWF